MKYKVKRTNKFVKDLKRCMKRGCNENLIKEVINMLKNGEQLPVKYKAHKLKGKFVFDKNLYIAY